MAAQRAALGRGGLSAASVAGLGRVLPVQVLSRLGRSQVAALDFATSNLRGAPVPVYIAGARALYTTSLGPLAGAPFNLTTLSYDGSLDMGLVIDPAAVEEPAVLRACLVQAYTDLIRAAAVDL